MGIIILILKIIGIIFLVLLLVLIILCFFPLPYVFRIYCRDNIFELDFKYIAFFFNFFVDFKNKKDMDYRASVLGKVIAKKEVKNKETITENAISIDEGDFIQNKDIKNEITGTEELITDLYKRAEEYNKEMSCADTDDKKDEIEKNKIKYFIDKIIDSYKKIFSAEVTDMAKIISHEVITYYKYLVPKKVKVKANIGMGEPYATGDILSKLAWVYAKYGDSIDVTPHFNKKVIDIDAKIIGKPKLINILMPAAHIFFNKRFREIMHKNNK